MRGQVLPVVLAGSLVTALAGSAWDLQQHLPSYGLQELRDAVLRSVSDLWALVGPGGKLHPTYFLEHQGHVAIEVLLVLVIGYLLVQQSYKPSRSEQEPLTEQEIDELCRDWQPEPLCSPSCPPPPEPPIISSITGTWVVANGKKVLNMASTNFLGIAGNPKVMEACSNTIARYGVGSCGPRGFYGTIDVHLQLEERLAAFMGTEESIIYSYDLATVPSVLPAFANKKDLIICDEGVSYPIQNGCQLSRAEVRTFKHNDMADLERVLQDVAKRDRRLRKPLNRRFIVVEGIYAAYGDVAPLDALVKIKARYRYRLVVDESLALGVLGAHGRGACEHFGLSPGEVEIVSASLGNALATVGGVCAGAREVVDHQRLSGAGYCFSASLPPYLAAAGVAALDHLQEEGEQLLPRVRSNAQLLRRLLADVPGLAVHGTQRDGVSPVIHVHLAQPPPQEAEARALLQAVVDDALRREGVLFTTAKLSPLDRLRAPPSIRVAVTAAHEERDLAKAAAALRAAARRVLRLPKTPERTR